LVLIALIQVFLISAMNHHISLLRLSVHRAYLEYLESGRLPQEPQDDAKWCNPRVSRTKWFDLFGVEDRKELMRGLWGVVAYLTRPEEDLANGAVMQG